MSKNAPTKTKHLTEDQKRTIGEAIAIIRADVTGARQSMFRLIDQMIGEAKKLPPKFQVLTAYPDAVCNFVGAAMRWSIQDGRDGVYLGMSDESETKAWENAATDCKVKAMVINPNLSCCLVGKDDQSFRVTDPNWSNVNFGESKTSEDEAWKNAFEFLAKA